MERAQGFHHRPSCSMLPRGGFGKGVHQFAQPARALLALLGGSNPFAGATAIRAEAPRRSAGHAQFTHTLSAEYMSAFGALNDGGHAIVAQAAERPIGHEG